MTFSHTTGTYNVHATLAAWVAGIYATAVPAIGAALAIVFDHPSQPLAAPTVSVHFIGDDDDATMIAQGGHVGGSKRGRGKFGLMEVDLWATRKSQDWRAELAQLHDALTKAVMNLYPDGGTLRIKDFYTSNTVPADTDYVVRIDGVEERGSLPDPNPEIERKRLIVTYSWVERV